MINHSNRHVSFIDPVLNSEAGVLNREYQVRAQAFRKCVCL